MFDTFVIACNAADELLIGKGGFPIKLKEPFINFCIQTLSQLNDDNEAHLRNTFQKLVTDQPRFHNGISVFLRSKNNFKNFLLKIRLFLKIFLWVH